MPSWGLLPALLLALVLAGCGSDAVTDRGARGGGTATSTAGPTGPSGAGGASPDPVTTSAPAVDGARPPASYDEAVARVAGGTEVDRLARSETPSANITCVLDEPDLPVGCEIAEGAVTDPAVCAEPDLSREVGRVELQAGVAVAVCSTDTIRTAGAPVLAHGTVTTTRDTSCLSEELGVTCVARNGGGAFFLRRGQYLLLDP